MFFKAAPKTLSSAFLPPVVWARSLASPIFGNQMKCYPIPYEPLWGERKRTHFQYYVLVVQHISSSLIYRSAARVYAFKLDTNFGAIPTEYVCQIPEGLSYSLTAGSTFSKGTVSFAATAANTGTESNHLTVETLTKSLQKSDMRRAAGLQSRSNIITDFLNGQDGIPLLAVALQG